MFVFDLSTKQSLPAISKWLDPDYRGEGDYILSRDSGVKRNHPAEFRKDFPEYCYQIPELMELKDRLNQTKRPMDRINSNATSSREFQRITGIANPLDALRGKSGMLVTEFGAEIVTNAWLKMFENMAYLEPLLQKLNKAKDKRFNTVHLAEAPGNFMLAINHYCKTNYPKLVWHWLANSYRDLYSSMTIYIGDTYHLMSRYRDNWIYGADGDGDITSPANIMSFKQNSTRLGPIHFLTSDVKYAPGDMNYDEEENYNIPVHMGHTICSLLILSKGGSTMLKEFAFFEAASVALLYLLACSFENLYITKPETSRPANSEVYIFGSGFKANITPLQIDQLLRIMGYVRRLNTAAGSPAIFRREDIPDDFIKRIVELETRLVDQQVQAMSRNLEIYERYATDRSNIYREFDNIRQSRSRAWIQRTKIKKLSPADRIVNIQSPT